MPKRNAVLMVVLAVAVIAAMGFLVLRPTSAPADDSARIESLIRKLGDPDSDVRREGECGLRTLGAAVLDPLARTAKCADRVLASRAAALFKELQPPPAVLASASPDEVDIEVLCSGAPEKAQRVGVYMVQLSNRGATPVLVALTPNAFAWFEVEDDQGRISRMGAEPLATPDPRGSVVPVGAGGNTVLCWGWKTLRDALVKPESRSLRFVYDASDPGYRAAVEKVGGGALLPPAKLVSKTFVLDVVR